jgi:hypothetical protein
MLKIVGRCRLLTEVTEGAGDAWLLIEPLQGEQHESCRGGNRLGQPPQDAAVAVVDTTFVESPIDEQSQAFGDLGTISLATASKSEYRPSRRFDPREITLRPGPTHELDVDVHHVGDFGIGPQDLATQLAQSLGGGLPVVPAEDDSSEQGESGRPGRLGTATRESIRSIGSQMVAQRPLTRFDGRCELSRFAHKCQ